MLEISTDQKYSVYTSLINKVARLFAHVHQVPQGNIVLTCGATGGIDAALGLMNQGDKLAVMPYEYFDIHKLAQARNIPVISSPCTGEKNDITSFIAFIKTHSPKACYISLPNNPLGQKYPKNAVIKVLQAMQHGTVFIDQALISQDVLPALWIFKNSGNAAVVIIYSLSKSHDIITKRAGYLITHNLPRPIHSFAHAPSVHTLQHMQKCAKELTPSPALFRIIARNNTLISTWIKRNPKYTWSAVQTNFGVLRTTRNVSEVSLQLASWGISCKTSYDLGCPGNFIRICLTTKPKDMKRFLHALEHATQPSPRP